MSAFAAFRKLSRSTPELPSYNSPFPNNTLSSNVKLGARNAIFADSSILIGLNPGDYVTASGTYRLKIVKGSALINSLHKIDSEQTYNVITNANEPLPVISGIDNPTPKDSMLPSFPTVIEIQNYDTGIQHIGRIQEQVKGLYLDIPDSQYTFDVKEEGDNDTEGIRIDQSAFKAVTEVGNRLTNKSEVVLVAGAAFSGKLTMAHLLLNYITINSPVAFLDLDPNSGRFSPPGCLSLSVQSQPCFGVFIPNGELKGKTLYYGHNSLTALPTYFMKCVRELKDYYESKLLKHSLIVNTPPGIKGLGRELLSQISALFKTSILVYLSQNGSPEVESFEDDFEVQDNPDDEVIADLTHNTLYKVHATRKKPRFLTYAHEIALLQYFHRIESRYDFSFLVELPPQMVSYSRGDPHGVPHVVSLHQSIQKLSKENVEEYLEASVVALCSVDLPLHLASKTYPQIITTNDFVNLSHDMICLCIVHLISKDGHYLVYLPRNSSVTLRLREETSKKRSLAFVRGDFGIPSGEFLAPQFEGRSIPYFVPEPLSKVGGVWNVRKNLGRKNQR